MSDIEEERFSRSRSTVSPISVKSDVSGHSRSRSKERVKREKISVSRSRSRSNDRVNRRSRSHSNRHHHRTDRREVRERTGRRSRSRSKSRSRGRHGSHSRSRRGYHRSHSCSPMSARRRHVGDREHPHDSKCLGVFGLSLNTNDRDIRDVFGKYGPLDSANVVYDKQSGRSRGFGFVYFKSEHDAVEAKERINGLELDGRNIRVDYSITERAHTPTPGVYLGRPTVGYRSRRSPEPFGRNYHSRSPSY